MYVNKGVAYRDIVKRLGEMCLGGVTLKRKNAGLKGKVRLDKRRSESNSRGNYFPFLLSYWFTSHRRKFGNPRNAHY